MYLYITLTYYLGSLKRKESPTLHVRWSPSSTVQLHSTTSSDPARHQNHYSSTPPTDLLQLYTSSTPFQLHTSSSLSPLQRLIRFAPPVPKRGMQMSDRTLHISHTSTANIHNFEVILNRFAPSQENHLFL